MIKGKTNNEYTHTHGQSSEYDAAYKVCQGTQLWPSDAFIQEPDEHNRFKRAGNGGGERQCKRSPLRAPDRHMYEDQAKSNLKDKLEHAHNNGCDTIAKSIERACQYFDRGETGQTNSKAREGESGVYGAYNLQSAIYTTFPLAGFAIGLAGLSSVEILTRSFYALRDSITPVIVSVLQFIFKIALS